MIQIDLWPKIGRISLSWFLRYRVNKVFGSLPAVTLIFDYLTQKANQHIYEPKYTCDQNWAKFQSLVFQISRPQGFWVIACCDLDLLIPKSTQHIYEPKYISDDKWVKSRSLIFEIWCLQGFLDVQAHSRMDTPENRIPPAPQVFVGGGITDGLSLILTVFECLHISCTNSI